MPARLILLLFKSSDAQRFALPALGRGRRSRPTGKMLRRVKLLEMCADSPASGARFVGQWLGDSCLFFSEIFMQQKSLKIILLIWQIVNSTALIFSEFRLQWISQKQN